MSFFSGLFKKKKDSVIPVSKLAKESIPENATILYQSEVPEWTSIGNLIFEKRYEDAVLLGKKLLAKNHDSAGVHINLMTAYFKSRNSNPEYLDLSTYHAKQAIIHGHNTGYAHERLAINLGRSGMIHQAIQLCDIILSDEFSFSSHGCGNKQDFKKRRDSLLSKTDKAKDSDTSRLFTEAEIDKIFNDVRLAKEEERKRREEHEIRMSQWDMELENESKEFRERLRKILYGED